jgi:uncharacterized iron-regulated membrane protein
MKRFRKVLFWCHLLAGAFAGLVIFVMSVTGVLLAYERQLIAWADVRGYQVTRPSEGAARLPLAALAAKAREARGASSAAPSSVTVRADADTPVAFGFGREGTVFLNPYTGEVLGEGSKGTRAFFQRVTEWHRWLGAGGENRAVGRAVTGACNLAFLFVVMSGAYLWWPRSLTWKAFRNVAWFRRGLPGRARDFNWHNTFGFWCVLPLFVVVLSAVVISYGWAGNLVYRAVGETPPAPRAPAPTPPAGQPERGVAGPSLDGLDPLLARAERQVEGWRSISLQLPAKPDAPAAFTIDRGDGGQPQKRAQLTLDRATGEVVRWEPFQSYTPGRRLRSYLRFAHTGEVFGLFGQTVAGLASLGGAALVYTGLALALRRLRAWLARRSKAPARAGAELSPAPETE